MEWIMGLASYVVRWLPRRLAFRDKLPNEETELISAVLTFTASTTKRGRGTVVSHSE